MKFLVIVVSAVFLMGQRCSDGCDAESMECIGSKVSVCNDEQNWETVMDCEKLSRDNDVELVCCHGAGVEPGVLSCHAPLECEETEASDE